MQAIAIIQENKGISRPKRATVSICVGWDGIENIFDLYGWGEQMKWAIGSTLAVRIILSLISQFYAKKAKEIIDVSVRIALHERSANIKMASSVVALAFWGLVAIYLWRKKLRIRRR